MNEKMKGVNWKSPYEVKKPQYEENDGVSETVTTGYIPINEQIKMIMRGEITVGNWTYDTVDDSDLEKESPEEFFEDATDYDTESEIREKLAVETSTHGEKSGAVDEGNPPLQSKASETSAESGAKQSEKSVSDEL